MSDIGITWEAYFPVGYERVVVDRGVDESGHRRLLELNSPGQIEASKDGAMLVLTLRVPGVGFVTHDSPQTPEERDRDYAAARIAALEAALPDPAVLDGLGYALEQHGDAAAVTAREIAERIRAANPAP